MEKLRYYNLGLVTPSVIKDIWNYTTEIPTLFSYTPNKTTIKLSGGLGLDEKIKADSVPSDIKIIEIDSPVRTSFIVDKNLLGFQFHHPDTAEYHSLTKAVEVIVIKAVRGTGIQLFERENDVFFVKGGMEKKFFGMMEKPTIEGWKVAVFSITMKFNSKLANKIYRFDDEKFTKKGDITDISTIVGGLDEVVKLDREKLTTDIVRLLAERYDMELEEKPYE